MLLNILFRIQCIVDFVYICVYRMKRLESTDRLIEGLQQELEEAVTCDSKTIDSQQSDGGHS